MMRVWRWRPQNGAGLRGGVATCRWRRPIELRLSGRLCGVELGLRGVVPTLWLQPFVRERR